MKFFLLLILAVLCAFNSPAQHMIKGLVVESDSSTVMPFVYIINKSNGNGTMSDNDGRFSIQTSASDTLVCSYVGYARTYVPVKNIIYNKKGEALLILKNIFVNLNPVVVSTFKIKPYERKYMNDIIDRSQVRMLDYATSPISALYMRYSREGKQVRKLARIFEEIFIEEQVQKKLSPEILRKLTGDENLDYEAFRKYCYYVNNEFILYNEGAELYSRVMECYKRYKLERTK